MGMISMVKVLVSKCEGIAGDAKMVLAKMEVVS